MFYHWRDNTLVLNVQAQPRASRDEIVGEHGDALRIRITAPPVDGAANQHLTRLLAEQFGVGRDDVRLVHGKSGRRKTFHITAPRRLPAGIRSPQENSRD